VFVNGRDQLLSRESFLNFDIFLCIQTRLGNEGGGFSGWKILRCVLFLDGGERESVGFGDLLHFRLVREQGALKFPYCINGFLDVILTSKSFDI
jgi:hypothetical protein